MGEAKAVVGLSRERRRNVGIHQSAERDRSWRAGDRASPDVVGVLVTGIGRGHIKVATTSDSKPCPQRQERKSPYSIVPINQPVSDGVSKVSKFAHIEQAVIGRYSIAKLDFPSVCLKTPFAI